MEYLTQPQAQDLACYFLGEDWVAYQIPGNSYAYLSPLGSRETCGARTWEDAFASANVILPQRGRFVSIGPSVMQGDDNVATCRSNTMAQRIAQALNWYKPGPRGK